MGFAHGLNEAVANSFVGKFFCIAERGSTFTTEIRAGTVTFLTMAYILAVNAAIVADTGGPCTWKDCTSPNANPGCVFGPDPGYALCREKAKRSMAAATAISSFVACFLMGILGNLPFALAPGMGINAFFTYTVVGFAGSGLITYQQALAAAFIEGWIFFAISISGLRGKIVQALPKAIMLSTAGGIGLFLAFIGLQGSEGLGVVTYEPATLVTLGGCPPKYRVHMYTVADPDSTCSLVTTTDPVTNVTTYSTSVYLGPQSPNYACRTGRMRSPTMWLGIMGGLLMVLLMGRNIKGYIMIGILFVTFIAWIPDHEASYFDKSTAIGLSRYRYFRKGVLVPDTSFTDLELDWSAFDTGNLWAALFSFLYLDFLDATGTFFAMANFMNKKMGGRFIDPITKNFPRITAAFCVDAISIWVGALLGIAPLTVYIESATGIREGGRTGITAITTSLFFLAAMFFTPIFASIPGYATGPALVLVGAMMMENLLDIDWRDAQSAIPAFLTIAVIPLTYSIAYGIIAGVVSYMFLWTFWLIGDILFSPITKKSIRDILMAAKPDGFMSEDELIAQEQERKRKRAEEDDEDGITQVSPSEKATPV